MRRHFGLAKLLVSLGLTLPIQYSQSQTPVKALPSHHDYPAESVYAGPLTAPRLSGATEKRFEREMVDGVVRGFGIFSGGVERPGPNFAGSMIVIQWPCGVPCMRMAMIDARTGEVYYPPISIAGAGGKSFDLPLLSFKDSVAMNPELEFLTDSNLMVIKATLGQGPRAYCYAWQDRRWALVRTVPLRLNR